MPLADFKHQGGAVGVGTEVLSRMLGWLTSGYEVVVAGPMQFINTVRIRVRPAAIRFERAYRDFAACEIGLFPSSFAQIE